jgi:hypothetical protein
VKGVKIVARLKASEKNQAREFAGETQKSSVYQREYTEIPGSDFEGFVIYSQNES